MISYNHRRPSHEDGCTLVSHEASSAEAGVKNEPQFDVECLFVRV